MSKVVIDIETIGVDFESLDDRSKEYLLRFAESEEEKEKVLENLALNPLTGEIVAIGMFNPDTQKGVMYYRGGENDKDFAEDDISFQVKTESEMLKKFWEDIKNYKQVISFNGRAFDGPFLHIRSAILKIKPSRNLVPYRYGYKLHCDLLDQLTHYGISRRFNLDFYTRRFGIISPKDQGINGSLIAKMFKEGRQKEIAQYCARDIKSTAKLYEYWDNYLKF